MDDFDREVMLETFLHEMGLLVDQLENSMIGASDEYTTEIINEIFRVMHTIKGSASMMMLNALAETTHVIEDLFFYLREKNPEKVDYTYITDLVLEVVDFVKLQLEKLQLNETLDEAPQVLKADIIKYLEELKRNNGDAPILTAPTEEKIVTAVDDNAIKKYSARIFFREGSEMENIRAYTILHNLKDIVTSVVTDPPNVLLEEAAWKIKTDGFQISCNSKFSLDEIKSIIMKSIYIREVQIEELGDDNIPKQTQENILGASVDKQTVPQNSDHEKRFEILFKFQDGCEMENVRAYAVLHRLKDICTIISHYPENVFDEANIKVIAERGFVLEIATNFSQAELEDILSDTLFLEKMVITNLNTLDFSNEKEGEIDMSQKITEGNENAAIENNENIENTVIAAEGLEKEQVEKDPSIIESQSIDITDNANVNSSILEAANDGKAVAKKTISHSISVNVHKLDQLLNLVGELVISEAMVTQNPELEGLELDSFTKESRQLRKIITEVQDTVMSMRMVPLSPTFFKMHRIVRDMCKQLKKDVQLEVVGDDTEVDKNIIEHIADPLMHIIRNSVDHGIEVPDERLAKGKMEKGTVVLEAKNSGGDVLIIVRDDGAGFKRDKILAKAKKQGLLSKPETDYTDKEVHQFIFHPGFSTNENVTSYSGRGVGMDVVSTNIEHVGATVIADSVEGEWSSITLKIPLTLAIIDGMIIKIGDAKYTIPIMDIKRSLKVSKNDIVLDPNNNEMIMVRGECYNLVRLNEYFGLDIGVNDIEEGIVLMLENSEQTVCVFADELIGEQQVVVKNIPKYIKKVTGLSGCTLLGNGDISLIVNVAAFFDR